MTSTSASAVLRVLVVDDNVDMATSLAILLRLHGHLVEIAHDGSAALDIAQSHPVDVILLDIGLPTIDGYEVARQIRERGREPQPLLVGISGYGFEADRQRAKDAGFDFYLVKPVEPELIETMMNQWSKERTQSPPAPG